ncbi:MAG: PAS domain S-box protein [Chloroflexi bacterium]|nr:PAS domain S-box protein [Chloroflexota bacterium]
MMSKILIEPKTRFRIPEICAALAIGIAILALAGWLSGLRFLAGQWVTYIPMAPSTALAFLLLGSTLFSFARIPALRVSRLFALTAVSIVFLMGLLVLVQFILGIDLGVEQILSRTNELLGSTPLGRMSPLTAVSFLLESAAFFVLINRERHGNAPTAASLLAIGGTSINAVVLIAYIYGAPLLYEGTIIPVALPTAIAFVLVGMGQIYLAAPGIPAYNNWSRTSMRGILLRAFLPFMLFFVIIQGWLDLTIQPDLSLNPAVWQSFMAIMASILIVIITWWIARRTGSEIERTQETLAESEERYRLLFENSGEAILLTRPDGTIYSANPEACRIFGRSADEITKLGRSSIIDPSDPRLHTALEVSKSMGQFKGELNLLRKDGTIFSGEVSTAIFKDSSGAERTSMTIRDITERKQREEDIKSRNDDLTTLYQLSSALADTKDLENMLELVNRHAVESVHTTFACIALLEHNDLVTRAAYPLRSLGHDFNIGGRQPVTALPVCQLVMEQNEPVVLRAGNPEVDSMERTTILLDFAQSVCLVPLRVTDHSQILNPILGLLILGEARGEKREPFTPEKLRLARSIGDQAAVAIRRLLLREQAASRLQRLASLGEIDRNIASNFDLHLNLKMFLQHVIKQLEVDVADVLVLNDLLQTLEFTAGLGFRSPAIEHMRLRLGEGQAGKAALERRSIQIPDLAATGDVFAQPELLEAEHVAAYFAVPLITKGQVKGVLEIFHRSVLVPDMEWFDFLDTLAGQAAIAIENSTLFESLQRSNVDLSLAYDATIEGWSRALDLRDKETEGHTQRVTEMTVKLARAFGFSKAELVQVRWGSLLHDIGKMGVPDEILHKPGPLTDEEWMLMRKHPTFAYEMLSPIRYLRLALDIPYSHHEKWDGSGYPHGLKGEQIPLVARIFAVVDVWDALSSDRPYRAAWTEEKVREYILAASGTHFDPQVVDLFMQIPK